MPPFATTHRPSNTANPLKASYILDNKWKVCEIKVFQMMVKSGDGEGIFLASEGNLSMSGFDDSKLFQN